MYYKKLKLSNSKKLLILFLGLCIIFFPHCSANRIQRAVAPPGKFAQKIASSENPYIKLHAKNGDVYILTNWKIISAEELVHGTGKRLNLNRQLIEQGDFNVSYKDVVLAESNIIGDNGPATALTFATIITGIFAGICIANPKACFGSCPTFYANNGEDYFLQAEGFSSSVSPCLEEKDIDALFKVKPVSRNFELQVRNEAFETHVIRQADILAVPRGKDSRIYACENGKFYETKNAAEASEVIGEEGDCSEKVCSFDGTERFSPADSNNLAEKEIIEVSFNNITAGNKGLVVASRQTLMTTFLFYQGLSYMGTTAGDWFANLERNSGVVKDILNNPRKELGRIEVLIQSEDGSWKTAGEIGEHGPIATDIKIVPLDYVKASSTFKLKLRMAKGLWRIDYLALADIQKEVEPVVIQPSGSFPERTASNNVVTKLLISKDSVLVTLPGEKYFLNYELPEDYKNYELFLESRGYYLEWMREEWLAEEDADKVYQMFFNPKQFYKDLAPQFKQVEAEMEETFWSSKYVHP